LDSFEPPKEFEIDFTSSNSTLLMALTHKGKAIMDKLNQVENLTMMWETSQHYSIKLFEQIMKCTQRKSLCLDFNNNRTGSTFEFGDTSPRKK